jgi:3-hydroxybutyryl-CoA dehydrogenase
MKLVVVTEDALLKELKAGLTDENIPIVQVHSVDELAAHSDADACIDLLFEKDDKRIKILASLLPKPVLINAVGCTLAETHPSFVRINGWPAFLKRNILEASGINESIKIKAAGVAAALNKSIDWVPDVPGFISARVVSMIVNEAYFALEENVSTREEIDLAMKLGTSYPYGPFEWGAQTGLKNIYSLLKQLSKTNPRYRPAALLEKEATV